MENQLPILFAAIVGFSHAFEIDHLVAVGNIVTKRNSWRNALKDGVYWGLGHTSTIFLIGIIIIIGKTMIPESIFRYFEATVGLMLVILGIYRLLQFYSKQLKRKNLNISRQGSSLAYGIGLVHGLAGSGSLIALVMVDIEGVFSSFLYLALFGLGSIAGMLVVASIFHLPFSKQIKLHAWIQPILVISTALLCLGYGTYLMWQSLI